MSKRYLSLLRINQALLLDRQIANTPLDGSEVWLYCRRHLSSCAECKRKRLPPCGVRLDLLVRESGQSAVLANLWQHARKVRYSLFAQFIRQGMIGQLDPRLKSSWARFNGHSGRKSSPGQLFHRFGVELVNEQQFRTVKRPKVDVAALGIHALQPGHTFQQFGSAPIARRSPFGLRVDDHDFVPPGAHRAYLCFDGFEASIAGRRYSATCAASRRLTTVGGASQSQNALARTAVTSPVVTDSR